MRYWLSSEAKRSLLCHYPIRAIICKNVPNQSTSEACNAPGLQSKLLQISCSMASLMSYGDMDTVATGSPLGLWALSLVPRRKIR